MSEPKVGRVIFKKKWNDSRRQDRCQVLSVC